ncbi:MAG: phosphotransferase [Candidatus Nanoarchaeia archaeon]|jgi:glycosyltransferase EpsD
MKFLFHVPWEITENSVGGTERFIINLCKEFKSMGHNVSIVCTSLVKQREVQGIPVYGIVPKCYEEAVKKHGVNEYFFKNEVLKGDIINYENYCNLVKEQIKSFDYDFLILNSFIHALINEKKPVLVINHDNPQEFDNYWGTGSYKKFIGIVKKNYGLFTKNKIFAVESKYYSNVYMNDLKIKCYVIPSGIDYDYYSKLITKKNLMLKYSINNPKIVFLVPCRLEYKQKGQDVVIKALGKIKDELPAFKVIFSGLDPAYKESYDYLKSLCEKNKIMDCALFKNFDDIREGYSLADIVLLPERFASYGFSLVQSISLGIPVIASKLPTFVEIASKVPYVKLIDNTPNDFAKTIKELITIGILKKNICYGKKFAKRLNWKNIALEYLSLLSKNKDVSISLIKKKLSPIKPDNISKIPNGIENDNFNIDDKYVLRVYSRKRGLINIKNELNFISYLASNNFITPAPCKIINNKILFKINNNYACLFPLINGHHINKNTASLKQIKNITLIMAKFHELSYNYNNKNYRVLNFNELINTNEVLKLLDDNDNIISMLPKFEVIDLMLDDLINRGINPLELAKKNININSLGLKIKDEKISLQRLRLYIVNELRNFHDFLKAISNFSSCVVHYDITDNNLLFDGDKITALLDFDDSGFANIMFDIGNIGMHWAIKDHILSDERCSVIMNNYPIKFTKELFVKSIKYVLIERIIHLIKLLKNKEDVNVYCSLASLVRKLFNLEKESDGLK